MIYLIRTTDGARARMRDGDTLKDPVRDVASDRYTVFGRLPRGITDEGAAGVEVKIAADEAEADEIKKRLAGHVVASTMSAGDYRAKVKAKIARVMRKQRHEPEPWEGAETAPTMAEVMAAGYPEAEALTVVLAEEEKRKPPPEVAEPPKAEPEEEKPSAKGRRGRGK